MGLIHVSATISFEYETDDDNSLTEETALEDAQFYISQGAPVHEFDWFVETVPEFEIPPAYLRRD